MVTVKEVTKIVITLDAKDVNEIDKGEALVFQAEGRRLRLLNDRWS